MILICHTMGSAEEEKIDGDTPAAEQKPKGDAARQDQGQEEQSPIPPEPIPKTDGPMSEGDIDAAMRGN